MVLLIEKKLGKNMLRALRLPPIQTNISSNEINLVSTTRSKHTQVDIFRVRNKEMPDLPRFLPMHQAWCAWKEVRIKVTSKAETSYLWLLFFI
jgi:capsid portal protein